MLLDPTKTVRELAVTMPNATRVFEKMKIDYCCGGQESLGDACAKAGLELEELSRLLQEPALPEPQSAETDARSLPLAELANRIVAKHHVFTRSELERLTVLLEKVCSVHSNNHRELMQIQSQFETLRLELEPHMMKEERILFPYIIALEMTVAEKRPAPFAPFGTVNNPIAAMMREHDAAGDILKNIRRLSGEFAVPADGCFSYSTLYHALAELEADLHQHIHVENNILFPRAMETEHLSRALNESELGA